MAGCDKEGKEIYNTISVEGCSNEEYNRNYIPESVVFIPPRQWQCEETMYRTDLQIAFYPSASLILEIYHTATSGSVPEGTHLLAPVCNEGFNAGFYPYAGKKTQGISFSSGSVIIEKTGEDYYIVINLSIEPESGGGTMIGNFMGPLTELPGK
ncbi:MAG: hypothetical protein JXN62_06720 [Bacteroidales bacterium]|nr:hypothetical protein [Bacteroidales bacterium]